MNNALELRQVNKRYGEFALQDLSLELPAGCILGLVGENGAGKSTTIRLIMNTIPRDSGEITVLGADNTAPGFEAVKEDIGIVLDEAYFPEVITAKQLNNVMKHTYRRWEDDTFFANLKRFDLPTNKAFKDMSRGMRMKLAIAVALSHAPRLLVLDEPTSGLDPIVRDEILEIFSEFTRSEDHAILISSHIVSDLEKLCDYIAFLHKGKLMLYEEKDRLLETYGILPCSNDQVDRLPTGAVVSREHNSYGSRCLVKRALLPQGTPVERASIEDIILFLVKGEQRQ